MILKSKDLGSKWMEKQQNVVYPKGPFYDFEGDEGIVTVALVSSKIVLVTEDET